MKAGVLILGLAAGLAAQAPAPLTLAQLEQMALAHNPTLRQAQDAVAAAAGRTQQAGLWPNPTVGYEGGQIRGGSFRGGEQGMFAQQTIPLGGKLHAAQMAAAAGEHRQEALAAAQRQAVRTAVQLAFYDALAAEREVALRRQWLAVARDAAATAGQRFNVGEADRPGVLQAQVEAEQAELDLTRAQRRRQQAWAQLTAVAGEPDLALQPLAGHLQPGPAAIARDTYLARMLTHSPAVTAAEAGLAQAEAQLRGARKQPIPDLQLRGGVEDNRELLAGTPRAAGLQSFASAGVTLPLFNRNQGNIAAAGAELDRSRQELTRVRLQLRAEAAPELAAYAAAASAAARYRHTMLPEAEQAYRLLRANYQAMYAPYPQVLAAQRTWLRLQMDDLATLRTLWRSAATLRGLLLTRGLRAPAGAEGRMP